MRHRRYGPDHDPVGRYVGEDVLGRALRRHLAPAERTILLHYLGQAPPEQLARRHGLSVDRLTTLISHLLERLRTSELAPLLRTELHGAGPRFSPEVWRAVKDVVPVHRCALAGCTAPPFVQKAVGHPRLYCSSSCRQAAYRRRRNAPPPPVPRPAEQDKKPPRYYHRARVPEPVEFPAPRPRPLTVGEWWAAKGLPVVHVPFGILPSGRRPSGPPLAVPPRPAPSDPHPGFGPSRPLPLFGSRRHIRPLGERRPAPPPGVPRPEREDASSRSGQGTYAGLARQLRARAAANPSLTTLRLAAVPAGSDTPAKAPAVSARHIRARCVSTPVLHHPPAGLTHWQVRHVRPRRRPRAPRR